MIDKLDIKVLIVEDEEDSRVTLVKLLSQMYTSVYSARDGKEAMEIIVATEPDIVVTDLNMPKMCGVDLIRWLIDREQAFIPTVITSAHREISREYRDMECVRLESKPITVRNLINKINELHAKSQKTGCSEDHAFDKLYDACNTAKELLTALQQSRQ